MPDRDRDALADLARRLEAAEGPSVDLDALVWRRLDTVTRERQVMPAYTASLDLCRELHDRLLPGFDWHAFTDCGACFGRVEKFGDDGEWRRYGPEAACARPELAWLAAISRALADPAP